MHTFLSLYITVLFIYQEGKKKEERIIILYSRYVLANRISFQKRFKKKKKEKKKERKKLKKEKKKQNPEKSLHEDNFNNSAEL